MVNNRKVIVVLPAYNASRTLKRTIEDIPSGWVDGLLLVDDASCDDTESMAQSLGLMVIRHPKNLGYGANQKTCYSKALELGADIVVMLHPDYQYTPKLIPAMVSLLAYGPYDVVLGSRILGGQAMKLGMPSYKYVSNRFLTLLQNLLLGQKLSEYHTGYRAFTRNVLEEIHWQDNAPGFVFDNQMLVQIIHKEYRIGEISCPAFYFPEMSSIGMVKSVLYGLGCLSLSIRFVLHRAGLFRLKLLD